MRRALDRDKVPPLAEAYSKLDEFNGYVRLNMHFSHEHLTSNSSWSELSGQKSLFVLAVATNVSEGVIEAIPWVIAYPFPHLFDGNVSIIGRHWGSRLQIFPSEIDNFALIDGELSLRESDLDRLKDISEREVKKAFAEILREPTIEKDWGGERSDLLTDRVSIDGKRFAAAFAFKGPAKFAPLTMSGLGKNGDQIDRLFSEPADVFVLQHCHTITRGVRGAMRAYAQQMGRPRMFALIDGYDTIRLLKAYRKCGF